MRAIRFQNSSVVSKSAVSETVRRVSAKALALLTRRAEINQRIRCIHQVVQGLRHLEAIAPDEGCAVPAATGKTRWPPRTEQVTAEIEARDATSHFEYIVGRMRPRRTQHQLAGLSRACRIALMEAAGAASLEEIRSRIERRKSFAFSDPGFADAAIVRTLDGMKDSGEVCCVRSGSKSLWQRIPPTREIDN
jgi:hypothetical protein